MKKYLLLFTIFIFLTQNVLPLKNPYWDIPGQSQIPAKIMELQSSANDTSIMILSRELGIYYSDFKTDSSLYYFNRSLSLARKLGQGIWQAEVLTRESLTLSTLGYFPEALTNLIKAQNILTGSINDKKIIGLSRLAPDGNPEIAKKTILCMNLNMRGILYVIMGDIRNAKRYYNEALKNAKELNDTELLAWISLNLAEVYNDNKNLDSAIYFNNQSGPIY